MAHLNSGKVFDNDPKDKLVNTKIKGPSSCRWF